MNRKSIFKYLVSFIVCISILTFCITPIIARAGGGGSGGSSGGGGSSSSTHNNHSGSTPYSGFIIIGITIGGFWLLKKYDVFVLSKRYKKVLLESSKKDIIWQKETIIKRIEEIYFAVQNGWSAQDLESLKNYITPNLYQQWSIKIEWMKFKYQQNILENIYLLDNKIIYVNDDSDDTKDYFFAYMQGKIKDSTIDTLSKITLETNNETFVEYWRFLRIDNAFYLDAVFQEDEINLREFKEE